MRPKRHDVALPAGEYIATPAGSAYWSGVANSLALAGVFALIGFLFWPLYLVSLLAVLSAPFIGVGLRTGPCPCCRAPLWGYAPEIECPNCFQKILRGGRFFASTIRKKERFGILGPMAGPRRGRNFGEP